ncbi:MAG: hypothetical protein ACXAE3_17800, partial [Candidatus Kariarchaeaceae archaeon]
QVSLVEISGVSTNLIDFSTKFQSESYILETGGVDIFDTNNNGIPELIYTVKGGDVFFLELSDIRQPQVTDYYITELIATQDTTPAASVEHVVAANLDGDDAVEYITASIAPGGTIEILDDDGTAIDELALGSIQDLYFEDGTIVAINDSAIFGLDTSLNQLYLYELQDQGLVSNYIIDDIDDDDVRELVFLQNTTLIAIEISTGQLIFQRVVSGAESSGFVDISTTIMDDARYYSIATEGADRYTVHIFNGTGDRVSAESVYYFNSTTDRTSHEIGDFDADGELEITLYRYSESTDSMLQLFDLASQDLFTVTPVTNITLPNEGLTASAAPDIVAMDTRNDGKMDIILSTNEANNAIDFPSLSASALYAIDMSSATIIWSRTLAEDLDKFEITTIDNERYYVLNTDNLGTFVLNEQGVDVFWLDTNALTSDISFASIGDTIEIVAVRVTGNADLFTTTGRLTYAENTITLKENKVVANTIQYYKLKDTVFTSYSNPVDINGDGAGASDLFVGFSNGTMALRNYELGEYWRIDVQDIESVQATELRYAPNQNGLAINYYPGNLVVFDRISTRPVINVTNDLGVMEVLDMKKLSPDGSTDYLLLRTKVDLSTTGFHLFNPLQERFVWNSTTGGVYDSFEIVNLDNSQPNYPTHIAYGSSVVSLIQLPTTLLTSGQIQAANDGSTWVDYKVVTTDEGLSKFYLLSSSGDLGIFTINLDQVDTYEEFDLGLTGITHFSIYFEDDVTYYLVEQITKSFVYIEDSVSLTNVLNITQPIYSTDELNLVTDFIGDSTPELLLYARNEMNVYDLSGELLEIHSFSSSSVSRDLWYPDLTGEPILVTKVFNENIEIIDPVARNYSSTIASVSSPVLDLEYEERGEFMPPEATWSEYIPPEEINAPALKVWHISIPLLITATVLIRRFRL